MFGPKIASPLTTPLIALSISALDAPLSRYPRAPACRAAKIESSSSCMLMTTMLMCGLVWRIRRVASMPLILGMFRSIRITSGCSSAASEMVSFPSVTSPTTSRSGAERSNALKPSRKWSWSSAISTRVGSTESCLLRIWPDWFVPHRVLARKRQERADAGTPGRGSLYGVGAAQLFRSLAHRAHPHACPRIFPDAPTVVLYLQTQRANLLVEHEADGAVMGFSVAHDV